MDPNNIKLQNLNEKRSLKQAMLVKCVSNLSGFTVGNIYTVNITQNEYDYCYSIMDNSNSTQVLNETTFNSYFSILD